MQLDVGLVIAGAKERGELESRLTKLLAEIKECGDVILMIDEVHTLVGAGSASKGGGGGGGGMDIANLIKPALARGEFQVIGATTVDEHRQEREAQTLTMRDLYMHLALTLMSSALHPTGSTLNATRP